MTEIGVTRRLRDAVRDSKIRKDIPSKPYQKIDSFVSKEDREDQDLDGWRHHLYYGHHQVGRDFPRTTQDEVAAAGFNRNIIEREGRQVMGFTSSFDEVERWFSYYMEKEAPFLGVYRRNTASESIIERFKRNLPDFDGFWHDEDLLNWIDAIEDFFEETNPPEKVKCKIVWYKMKGRAYYWWKVLQNDRFSVGKDPISSWSRMRKLLISKFAPSLCSNKGIAEVHRNSNCEANVRNIYVECSIEKVVCNDSDNMPSRGVDEPYVEIIEHEEKDVCGSTKVEKFMATKCLTDFCLESYTNEHEEVNELKPFGESELIYDDSVGASEKSESTCLIKVPLEADINNHDEDHEFHSLRVSEQTYKDVGIETLEKTTSHLLLPIDGPAPTMALSGITCIGFSKALKFSDHIRNEFDEVKRDEQKLKDEVTATGFIVRMQPNFSIPNAGLFEIGKAPHGHVFINCGHQYRLSSCSIFDKCTSFNHSKFVSLLFDPGGDHIFGKSKCIAGYDYEIVEQKLNDKMSNSFTLLSNSHLERRVDNHEFNSVAVKALISTSPMKAITASIMESINPGLVVSSLLNKGSLEYSTRFKHSNGEHCSTVIGKIMLLSFDPDGIPWDERFRNEPLALLLLQTGAVKSRNHDWKYSLVTRDEVICRELYVNEVLEAAGNIYSVLIGELQLGLYHQHPKPCVIMVDERRRLTSTTYMLYFALEFEDREQDSSAYTHYVTLWCDFVMFCGMLMVSFDPGGKRRIEPKTNDKRGQCLVANQGAHSPVVILWVGNKYRNAGYSLGVEGVKYVHWAVKMVFSLDAQVLWILCSPVHVPEYSVNICKAYSSVTLRSNSTKELMFWTGYRDSWHTIKRWKILHGFKDLHLHIDEENASFIFDPGGVQWLTEMGNFDFLILRSGVATINASSMICSFVKENGFCDGDWNSHIIFKDKMTMRMVSCFYTWLGRCYGLVYSMMLHLLKSQACISARIIIVYSCSHLIDMRSTWLHCSLWYTCRMRVWFSKSVAIIYFRRLNVVALLEFCNALGAEITVQALSIYSQSCIGFRYSTTILESLMLELSLFVMVPSVSLDDYGHGNGYVTGKFRLNDKWKEKLVGVVGSYDKEVYMISMPWYFLHHMGKDAQHSVNLMRIEQVTMKHIAVQNARHSRKPMKFFHNLVNGLDPPTGYPILKTFDVVDSVPNPSHGVTQTKEIKLEDEFILLRVDRDDVMSVRSFIRGYLGLFSLLKRDSI